jgi:CHAT domain-containing protein/tetratricopeptide (TPR) repeat protein
MNFTGLAGFSLFWLMSSGLAAAAPADCSVPADRLLHRLDLELPGDTRVMRSVDIPADTEILIEAFEKNVNAWLEVRSAAAEVAAAENALHRWPPHRLIVASGPARKLDVTVIGIDRARGRVELRISRLAFQKDRRCVDFLRAMANGDAAYSRGAAIFRGEVDAAAGVSERAYESAIAAYASAARILGAGGFDEAQTQLVHASALMNAVERFPESLEAASVAEARFKALGHEYGRDLARFHWAYSLAYDAMRTKDAAEAKRKFETARTTFHDVAAGHRRRGELFDHAQALDGVACANGFLFRYSEAIDGYQRALEIFEELGEPDRAVAMRQNLAYFESQFGRNQESLKRHLEILAEGDSVKDPAAYLVNLKNAAFLELKLGQYDAALQHYSDAYARSVRIQSDMEQARALYGLGMTYHAIGNFSESLSYLQRSLELRPEQQVARSRSTTLRSLANVLRDTHRGREAIARREEALDTTQIPPEKARITLELIDDRIEVGDLAIAKTLIATLLATRDLPDPAVRVGATLASARIALAEGDAVSAARDARVAADYYRSHELVSSEFAALLVQARAACAAGARDTALDLAAVALERAEEIRTFSSNPTLRASLWRPFRPAFGFTIGLLARANSCGGSAPADPLGALAIAEASRGRALEDFRLRSADESAARSRSNERRRALFEQLAGVRQQLETLSTTASADDERLKTLRTEAGRLRREIDLTGGLPDASRQRALDLRPTLRARVDAIPKDAAVVEYWLGKDEAFAWLLTRGRAQLVDLGPAGRIDAAARRMHDAMHSWLTGTAAERIERGRELHGLIIAPLPADLARARTVYFIADGALHAVPFAALASGDAGQPRFLVDSHDVAVAPAFLAIASASERRAVRRNSSALVVVDPVYARDDARFSRPTGPAAAAPVADVTLRGSRSWSRLPATAREAATIAKLLDRDSVEVLSGFGASRESLLARNLTQYDILHFATHAVADTEAPQLSALVLSTLDAQGNPRVGEVFAGDLADQRVGASLVVFSGCETALGRAEAGEGLLSLRYAAHASGAHSVVASLWPVMDAAGAHLMDDLYADVIGRSASPVAAMSRAMRGARGRWNDPALWAAFDVSIAGF